MDDFHGVLAVLCTPFMPDESLDYDSLRRLADYVVDEGAHAVVCLGLASETNRLSEEEKRLVVETVVAQVGDRVPVISGLQAAATVEAVRHGAVGWWECGCGRPHGIAAARSGRRCRLSCSSTRLLPMPWMSQSWCRTVRR